MRNSHINNIPLPTLKFSQKVTYTSILLAALGVYIATWTHVLFAVYWKESSFLENEFLGVQLGVLAMEDSARYLTIFSLHAASLVLLISTSFLLFRKTSIRRRVKSLIFGSAVVLALLDLLAWWKAPGCSPSNLYVGVIGIVSAFPLVFIASSPLFQMWIFKRWKSPDGKKKRVAIVGGGFAGLYAALGINRKLGYNQELEITLIDRKNYFLFPPLLPSAAAGTIETRQVSYPFRRIFETTNIRFRKASVSKIDPNSNTIYTTIETNQDPLTGETIHRDATIEYDYLVLAPGSTTQTFNTKGAAENAFFMRELNDAVLLRNHVIDCFERAANLNSVEDQQELLRFVIVGAGPTGIETATEIYDLIHHVLLKRYPEIDPAIPDVCILQSGKQILPGWHSDIVKIATKQLSKMTVKVHFKSRVVEVLPNRVVCGDSTLTTRTVVWCAGVKPSPLLERSGLPVHKSGRVVVDGDLRAQGFENVFVLGDATYLVDKNSNQALPPLGQVAFQQGSHTANNLVRLLSNQTTKPFKYFDFGGLVSVGEHFAAVNLMGVRVKGFLGWLIWRSLYLAKLVGTSNKIRVMIDWTLDLLIERSISQIRDTEEDYEHHLAPPQRAVA